MFCPFCNFAGRRTLFLETAHKMPFIRSGNVDRLLEQHLVRRQRHHVAAGVATGTSVRHLVQYLKQHAAVYMITNPSTLGSPEKLAMSGVISTDMINARWLTVCSFIPRYPLCSSSVIPVERYGRSAYKVV